MTDKEQTNQLYKQGEAFIERARREYDISYAAMIGVLMLLIKKLEDEATKKHEDQ